MNSRNLIVAASAASLLIGASGPARAAPASPAFPRSTSLAEVGRWLSSQTDIPLASVVLVGPGYVFSFPSPDPVSDNDGLVWKQVREEVTTPAMQSRLNGRSASAVIAFACRRDQATASNVAVYDGNGEQPQPGRPMPAADWLVANPGLYLMDLAAAACNPNFRRPFAASATTPDPTSTRRDPVSAASTPPRQETGVEHWVQVGAFANAAAANRKWRDIKRALPTQSAGRSVKIEQAGAGKTLVRAMVGPFHGAAPAQAFCTALKGHGGDCLVR
jgi:SPOR domain